MKKFDVNKPINNLKGEPFKQPEILEGKQVGEKDMVVGDILIGYIGVFSSKDGRENIIVRRMGEKIFDALESKDDGLCEFEDGDFTILLTKVLAADRQLFGALVMGPVFEYLEDVKSGKVHFDEQKDEIKEV